MPPWCRQVSAVPLKIFGALLLSFAGFLGGSYFVRRLQARQRFFREMEAFLSALSTALRYQSADIFTLVNSSTELFCFSQAESGLSFSDCWNRRLPTLAKRWSLSAQDVVLLREFGAQLGATDAQGQLAHIECYQSLFQKQQREAEENLRGKAKLYQTLGLFTGVSAALMLL